MLVDRYHIQMKQKGETEWKDTRLHYSYVPEDSLFVAVCTSLFEETGSKPADFRVIEIETVVGKVHKTLNSRGMAKKLLTLDIADLERRKSKLLADIKNIESTIKYKKEKLNGGLQARRSKACKHKTTR